MLAGIEGLADLTLTTNGSLLATKAEALADAGLQRVTVSLDSLDDATFAGSTTWTSRSHACSRASRPRNEPGLAPIKVNMVVRRGLNEDSVLPMARFARERGYTLRFIEYMDVGHTNGWALDEVVPAAEIVAAIDAELPLEPLDRRSIRARSRRAGATAMAAVRSASSAR